MVEPETGKKHMSQAEQRRIADLQARIISLETEVEHWRDRALRAERASNVVPLRTTRPMEPVSAADMDQRAISKLDIPVHDPHRNLILDPYEPRKGEPEA